MEKILVMNGMSLLEFTSELMTSIYHLKKHCVVGPGWMLFLQFLDHVRTTLVWENIKAIHLLVSMLHPWL